MNMNYAEKNKENQEKHKREKRIECDMYGRSIRRKVSRSHVAMRRLTNGFTKKVVFERHLKG